MKTKRFIHIISILLVAFFISCEDEEKLDGALDHQIKITYPSDNEEIFEIITVRCSTTLENNETLEFMLFQGDGNSVKLGDIQGKPWEFEFNTIMDGNTDGQPDFVDGSYFLSVNNADKTAGDTISIIIDNTLALPSQIDIISVTPFSPYGYSMQYTIIWEKSQDGDFRHYYLETSEDLENFDSTYQRIFETDKVDSTSYVLTTGSPTIDRYFRISVIDTFDLETKGQIISSSGATVPDVLEIVNVTYDTTNFYITWKKSINPNFNYYELKCSNPQENGVGGHEVFGTVYDINDTTFTAPGFTPLGQNYFFVRQVDSTGVRPGWHLDDWELNNNPYMTESRAQTIYNNNLDVSVISIDYDAVPRTFTWEASQDPFFKYYEIEWKDGQGNGERIPLDSIYIQNTNTSTINYWDNDVVWNEYYVNVIDFWNVKAIGTGFGRLEDPGPTAVSITDVLYNENTITVTWDLSEEADFYSYELLTLNGVWPDQYVPSTTLIEIYDANQNSFTISDYIFGENNSIYFSQACQQCSYLYVRVTDIYGNIAYTNGISGVSPNTPNLIKAQYDDVQESYEIIWNKYDSESFGSYILYRLDSLNESIEESEEIFYSNNISDTSFVVENITLSSIEKYALRVISNFGFPSKLDTVIASPWIKFSKTLNDGDWYRRISIEEYSSGEGGYIVAGEDLIFTDKYGELIWNVENLKIGDLILDNENIVVAAQSSVKKFSINGEMLWETGYASDISDGEYSMKTICKIPDGYVIAGTKPGVVYERIMLQFFDESGYSPNISGIQVSDIRASPDHIISTSDGGLLIAGWAPSGAGDGYLVKTDIDGNIEWSDDETLNGGYDDYNLLEYNNIYYVTAGDYQGIYKFDQEGNLLNQITIDYPEIRISLSENSIKGEIFIGVVKGGSERYPIFLGLDNELNIIWEKDHTEFPYGVFTSLSSNADFDIIHTNDIGYAFASSLWMNCCYNDIWFFKTDPYGNSVQRSSFGD